LVDIPFPSAYRSFISVFNFITLNFVPWQSVGCVTALNYYDKVLVVTITPIVRHVHDCVTSIRAHTSSCMPSLMPLC